MRLNNTLQVQFSKSVRSSISLGLWIVVSGWAGVVRRQIYALTNAVRPPGRQTIPDGCQPDLTPGTERNGWRMIRRIGNIREGPD
ncbi:MAG: hypothetical protein IPM81_20490 [Saprospirales bacterium]|nr:hypothetical protein [Saprospirales bacterium]